MKRLNFKKEKICIILIMSILFSFILIPLVSSNGCCLNPAISEPTKICSSDVSEGECCGTQETGPFITDENNPLYDHAPKNYDECKDGDVANGILPFFVEGYPCSDKPNVVSDKCRVPVCCCGDAITGGTDPICRNLGYIVIWQYTDGTPCATTCSAVVTNTPPTATDLTESTTEDIAITITLYCSDTDGDDLTYIEVEGTSHGSLSSISENQVTYTPNTDYTGHDSFTYKCSDGTEDGNTATVSITTTATCSNLNGECGEHATECDYGQLSNKYDCNIVCCCKRGYESNNDGSACVTTTTTTTSTTTTSTTTTSTSTTTTTTIPQIPVYVSECISLDANIPSIRSVYPENGRAILKIRWSRVNNADSYVLFRCDKHKDDCIDDDFFFVKAIQNNPTSGCTASICQTADDTVWWNQDFTYKVKVISSGVPSGFSNANSANVGDIACEGRNQNEIFCKDNKVGRCVENDLQVTDNCPSSKTCVETPDNAFCRLDTGSCGNEGAPFGMYFTPEKVNNRIDNEGGNYYIYYDYSKTIKDNCYSCEDLTTCYDYRSEIACNDDLCSVRGRGQCNWISYGDDLGNGVCINTNEDNCGFCLDYNPLDIPPAGAEAFNRIFDACTAQKAEKLSAGSIAPNSYDCYFTAGNEAKSCKEMTCYDYVDEEGCVNLDPCNLNVCDWSNMRCFKNANNDGHDDCEYKIEDCKEDMKPPTLILDIGPNIVLSGSEIITLKSLGAEPELNAYLCIDQETYSDAYCNPKSNSNIVANPIDISLEEVGNPVDIRGSNIGTLQEGTNYLRYYVLDEFDNNVSGSFSFEVDSGFSKTDDHPNGIFIKSQIQSKGTISGAKLELVVGVEEVARCEFILKKSGAALDAIKEDCYSIEFDLSDYGAFDNLGDGDYSLEAECWDLVGWNSDKATILTLHLDTTPPTAPTITDVRTISKHWDGTSMYILAGEDITIYGIVDERDTAIIKFYVSDDESLDGSDIFVANITDVKKLFTQNISYSYFTSDGNYYILVVAEDLSGNQAITPVPVVKDNQAPTISFIFPSKNNLVKKRVYSDLPDLEVDVNDNVGIGAVCVKIYTGATGSEIYYGARDNDGCLVDIQPDQDGKITYALDTMSQLVDGTYTVLVIVYDKSGNSAQDSAQFGIDWMIPTDPTITFMAGNAQKSGSSYNTEDFGADTYFHFKSEDVTKIKFDFVNSENVIIKEAELDSKSILDKPVNDIFTYDNKDKFTEGEYEFKILAQRDLLDGTYGTENEWVYHLVVDKTPPFVEDIVVYRLVNDKGTTDTSDDEYVKVNKGYGTDSDRWFTNTIKIKIEGRYIDNNRGSIVFTSPAITETATPDKIFTTSLTLSECGSGAICDKTVNFEAKDHAGNSIGIFVPIKLDTTGPDLQITNIDLDADGERGWYYAAEDIRNWNIQYYTRYDKIYVKGTAKAGSKITAERDGTKVEATANENNEFILQLPIPAAEGNYTFTINATDMAGTTETAQDTVKVTKDITPPAGYIGISEEIISPTSTTTTTLPCDVSHCSVCNSGNCDSVTPVNGAGCKWSGIVCNRKEINCNDNSDNDGDNLIDDNDSDCYITIKEDNTLSYTSGYAACSSVGKECTGVKSSCHNLLGGEPSWNDYRYGCDYGSSRYGTSCVYVAVCKPTTTTP